MRRLLKFTWSIDTGRIEPELPGDLWLKRGELLDIQLTILEDGDRVLKDSADTLTFTLKPKGYFDQDPLVQVVTWTEDATAKTYTGMALVESTQIDTLLLADASTANDLTDAPCVSDFFIHSAGTGYDAYSDSLDVTLKNNAGRDTDGTPISTAAADSVWCRQPGACTSLTGFANSLSALDTSGTTNNQLPVGNVIPVVISHELQWWELRSGTQATVSGQFQRPDDYTAGSPKYWQRIA